MQTHHETQDVQGVADLQDTAATAQVDLTDEVGCTCGKCDDTNDDSDCHPFLFQQKQKENQGRNLGQENSARQDDSANKIMADSSDDNKKDAVSLMARRIVLNETSTWFRSIDRHVNDRGRQTKTGRSATSRRSRARDSRRWTARRWRNTRTGVKISPQTR